MSSIISSVSDVNNIKEFDTFIVYMSRSIFLMIKEGSSHISRTYYPLKFTKVVNTVINVSNVSTEGCNSVNVQKMCSDHLNTRSLGNRYPST